MLQIPIEELCIMEQELGQHKLASILFFLSYYIRAALEHRFLMQIVLISSWEGKLAKSTLKIDSS